MTKTTEGLPFNEKMDRLMRGLKAIDQCIKFSTNAIAGPDADTIAAALECSHDLHIAFRVPFLHDYAGSIPSKGKQPGKRSRMIQ